MPTVLRVGPYHFFFYAGDRDEPPHVHVEHDDKLAKFWLDPIRLQSNRGFSRAEIGRIQKILSEHQQQVTVSTEAGRQGKGSPALCQRPREALAVLRNRMR